jgi:hypothetical protein
MGHLDAIHNRPVGGRCAKQPGKAASSNKPARSRAHVESFHNNATAESMRVDFLIFACLITIRTAYRPFEPASARLLIAIPTLCYRRLSCPVMSCHVWCCPASPCIHDSGRLDVGPGCHVGRRGCGSQRCLAGSQSMSLAASTHSAAIPFPQMLRHVPLGKMLKHWSFSLAIAASECLSFFSCGS